MIATTALGLFCLLASTTGAAKDGAAERLAEAERLIAARETSAAIDLYRALLADGVDGAGLRYNLGTLLLDRGDLGEAVAQLRAAQRRDPLDDDVRHNLEAAVALRSDQVAGTAAVDPWRALGEAVPPRTARLVLAVPLLLLGLCGLGAAGVAFGAGSLASTRVGLAKLFSTGAAALALVAAVGAVVLVARASAEARREAVVVTEEAPARKGPDAEAEIAFTAHAGLLGAVVDESGAFRRLRFDNGLEAWIDAAVLVEVPR
jgi:tetratricopeptide (TPR) repeat protein